MPIGKCFLGYCVLICLLCLASITPFLSPYSYQETNLALANHAPSWNHWFGTDDLGRDVFTRVSYGISISLGVGLAAAVLDLIIGFFWGGIAGMTGGIVEKTLMRIIDILVCIPSLILSILLVIVLGNGIYSLILALGLTGWVSMARLVRSEISFIKNQDYYLNGKLIGASSSRLLFHYILPNIFHTVLICLTLTIPSAIFSEAFLSFLGIGVQAPIASLGSMAFESLNAYHNYPWRLFFPSIFITLIIFSFYLIAEGLKEQKEMYA